MSANTATKAYGKGCDTMAQVIRGSALILLASIVMVSADISSHPKDAGESMSRNSVGSMYEGIYDNPALLGVERIPRGGLLLLPFSDIGVGYWSDKLWLRPYRAYLGVDADTMSTWQRIIEESLINSFDLGGLDPDATAKKTRR